MNQHKAYFNLEIYVVVGRILYHPENHKTWVVRAFTDEKKANQRAEECQSYSDKFVRDLEETDSRTPLEVEKLIEKANRDNPYDKTKSLESWWYLEYEYYVVKTILEEY